MKRLAALLAVFFAVTFMSEPFLFAERRARRSPGVDKREHSQRKRIRQGVRSGELTEEEAKELRKEQRQIHKKKRKMKSDGALTAEERRELHQDQNKANREIYRQKHDADTGK